MALPAVKRYTSDERPEILDVCQKKVSGLSVRKLQRGDHIDLGFHPDTVLAAFTHLQIHPRQFGSHAMYGKDFVAVRVAPAENHTLENARVETIHLHGVSALVYKQGREASNDEIRDLFHLAEGETVKGWLKI